MLGAVIVAGAWTDAPLNPPANNVAAPLNVGNLFQVKEGGLQLRGLFVEGKGVFSTSTYSIPSNTTLAVNGAVSANSYCDVNGQNCKSAADIASAVTGGTGGDKIVCGGWDTKYGSGTVEGSQWGCVPAGSASCPVGYDAVSSSHVTINLAEQTNLCVLSRVGVASSAGTAKAWVTFRNLNGTVSEVGDSHNVTSVASGSGTKNYLAADTIITFAENLVDDNFAVLVSPSINNGGGYYDGRVLDWVCVWDKVASNKIAVRCAYLGYGAYGNSIASVVVFAQ